MAQRLFWHKQFGDADASAGAGQLALQLSEGRAGGLRDVTFQDVSMFVPTGAATKGLAGIAHIARTQGLRAAAAMTGEKLSEMAFSGMKFGFALGIADVGAKLIDQNLLRNGRIPDSKRVTLASALFGIIESTAVGAVMGPLSSLTGAVVPFTRDGYQALVRQVEDGNYAQAGVSVGSFLLPFVAGRKPDQEQKQARRPSPYAPALEAGPLGSLTQRVP